MNFCTLFDINYFSRGLNLYWSLSEKIQSFTLYVYCFDDLAYRNLRKIGLPNLVPVAMTEFESIDLLKIKSKRTIAEYCWTCTPHIIRHALLTYGVSTITYLDADLYFFESPEILYREFDATNASVLITEHRYTPCYDKSTKFGIYCVQFMIFRNNKEGNNVLNWWADRCLEWCFARVEDGKFGDQKYLDDWLSRFDGVHSLKYLGGGVAPWNVQQYSVYSQNDGIIELKEKSTNNIFKLIFYHFHGLQIYTDGEIDLSSYKLDNEIKNILYKKYLENLIKISKGLINLDPNINFHGSINKPNLNFNYIRFIKRRIVRWASGVLNVQKINDIKIIK